MASNLSFDDFQTNFLVQVRGVERSHHDETGVYSYAAAFNVVCTTNNRVMYFEKHISPDDLTALQNPGQPTEQELIDFAWDALKADVKTWATTVVSSSNLVGASFAPSPLPALGFSSTSNFTLDTFTSNFDLSLARFEVYPPLQPSSWCVGFNAQRKGDASVSMYIDTNVMVQTFANLRAEQEIMDDAWSNVKETIGTWAQQKYTTSQLLNTAFTPSACNW